MNAPRSFLFVRLSSLGDIATLLPVEAELAARGLRVGHVVEERFAPLLAHANFPLEVHVWRRGLRGRRALRGVGTDYDVALDVQGNWKSGFVASALRAPRLVGLAWPELRERGNAWFVRDRAAPARGAHVLHRSLAVLEHATGQPQDPERLPAPPFLDASDEEKVRIAAPLPPEARIALVLARPGDPRGIPQHHLEALAREFAPEAFLLAGPAESELHLPEDLSVLRQERGIAELVALGALLRERGGVALGHDSGAMHVLRAAGVSTRFVFGPQDPARTGPFGEEVLVGREPLSCRPCVRRSCTHPSGPVCMTELAMEELRSAILPG